MSDEIEQLTSAVLKLTRAVHGLQKEMTTRLGALEERVGSTERPPVDFSSLMAGVQSKFDMKAPDTFKWRKDPWPPGR